MRWRMWKGSYPEYLKTDHWLARRSEAKRRAGYRCEECGAKHVRLEVHHLTYKNIGAERPEDLQVLCRPCHATKGSHKVITPEELIRACEAEWAAARTTVPLSVEQRVQPYKVAEAVREAPGGLERWVGKVVQSGDWSDPLTATVEGVAAGHLIGTDQAGEIVVIAEREIIAVVGARP